MKLAGQDRVFEGTTLQSLPFLAAKTFTHSHRLTATLQSVVSLPKSKCPNLVAHPNIGIMWRYSSYSNYIQFIPTYNSKCYLDSNGTQSIGNNPMVAGFSCNRTTSSSRHFTFAFTPDWFLGWSWGWVSTVQVYHTYTVEVSKNGGCPKPVVSRLKYATKWFH